MFSLLDVLALLTVALLGVLTAGLLAHRPRRTGTALLAALLLVNVAAVGRGILARQDLIGATEAGTLVGMLALFFAIPPLLYGFVVRSLRPGRTLSQRDLAHLGPAALALAAVSVSALLLPEGRVLSRSGAVVYLTALHATFLVYAGMALREVRAAEAGPVRRGVAVALGVFVVHWVCSAASSVLAMAGAVGASQIAEAASWIALLEFAGAAVILSLRGWPALSPPRPTYADSPLSATDLDRLADRIEAHLVASRAYLDPTLSVDRLANEMDVSARQLSQALNHGSRGGFAATVNRHRVAEAQRLLSDPAYADATILAVLYDAGFNSKSAFHRAFRQEVGCTPSAYRARAQRGNGRREVETGTTS